MRKGSSEQQAGPALLLLDVNVLLALGWPNHQFHAAALERLEQRRDRWATCALTQLGFIRLSSNPAVVGVSKSPAEAASLLALLVRDSRHFYLASLPSPVSEPHRQQFEGILGHKQVTDLYLLWLAERNRAKLVTFDSRLAVLGRPEENVEVLKAW